MTPSTPAVSVIVLSYNRAEYLRVALDSVAAQTSRDFEVVIADDCSSDPAVDNVLREYAPRFERFTYERYEHNVGVVANLLRAVAKTTGRYVTVLCDDDAIQPEYVARMRETLDADASAVVAFCNVSIIDSRGRVDAVETAAFRRRWGRDGLSSAPVPDLLTAALCTRSLQPAMGAVFRKDAIAWNDFPEEAAGAWDTWLGYLAAREGGRGAFVADRLFCYRVHANALTARRDVKWHRGEVDVYLRFLADQRLSALVPLLRARLARYYCELGMTLLRQGKNVDARPSFENSQRFAKPIKAWVGGVLSYFPPGATRLLFRYYDWLIHNSVLRERKQ